jgi:hypothetical protein
LPRSGARTGGQATVELALALPFVVTALLLVAQVGLVVRAQLLVQHAAREGARAVAVGDEAPAPVGLDPGRTSVAVARSGTGPGDRVTVTVTYRLVTDLPLVGPLVPDLDLRGRATMRVE